MRAGRSSPNSHGFTLIELMIVVVIVSLMTGFGIKVADVPSSNDCSATTRAQLNTVRAAMDHFAQANNRFPIPAGRSFAASSPFSGREASSPTSLILDHLPANGTSPALVFGALPYQALGLPSTFSSDCWGNKFSYVITENLTSSDPTTGMPSTTTIPGIVVKTGTLSDNQVLSNNVAYAVVSHGASGVGGVSRNYSNTANHGWCSTGTAVDTENCNTNNNVMFSSVFNNGKDAGGKFFDDLLVFGGKPLFTCTGTDCPGNYSDCAGGSVTWGTNCSATVTAMTKLETRAVSYTGATYSGTGTVTCRDGNLSVVGSCGANCTATTTSWSGNVSGCSANVGALNYGATTNVTSSSPTGSATASCGTGGVTSSGSCDANCPTKTVTWSSGCSASVGPLTSGTTLPSVSSDNGTYTGHASVSCNNGSYTTTPTDCSAAPVNCPAGDVSWPTGSPACYAHFSALNDGSTSPTNVNNAAPNHTGSAKATCTNGVMKASGTCYASCGSTVGHVWGGSCSGDTPVLTHGQTYGLTYNSNGYFGSDTVTCNNGTLSDSTNPPCSSTACTLPWDGSTVADGTTNINAYKASYSGDGTTDVAQLTCTNGALNDSTGLYKYQIESKCGGTWDAATSTCTGQDNVMSGGPLGGNYASCPAGIQFVRLSTTDPTPGCQLDVGSGPFPHGILDILTTGNITCDNGTWYAMSTSVCGGAASQCPSGSTQLPAAPANWPNAPPGEADEQVIPPSSTHYCYERYKNYDLPGGVPVTPSCGTGSLVATRNYRIITGSLNPPITSTSYAIDALTWECTGNVYCNASDQAYAPHCT